MKEIQALAGAVEGAVGDALKGFDFVPEKKRSWKPEGTAKNAEEIAKHVAYWNLFCERVAKGADPLAVSESEWTNSNKELRAAGGARAALEQSGQAFASAIKALKPEQLGAKLDLPSWGNPTMMQLILGNFNHICYHAGQLNYLQTLLGDIESH